MNQNIALVLEGGGFRGAYTAGAMKWLAEHNLKFKYTVAISATAIYGFYYAADRIQQMEEISTKGIKDPCMIGIQPLIREQALVGYNAMREKYLMPTYNEILDELRQSDRDIEVGLYNMTRQQLEYYNKNQLDEDGQMLKATCVLPLSNRMTEVNGNKYLDGGIEVMVSCQRAMDTGHEKMLVIVTKDKNYVRKPNGFFLTALLRMVYHKFEKMLDQLDKRTQAYYDQMDQVYKLEEEGKALLIRPSNGCGVGRFTGSLKQLEQLFQVGWQDMEDRKDEIMAFLEDNR